MRLLKYKLPAIVFPTLIIASGILFLSVIFSSPIVSAATPKCPKGQTYEDQRGCQPTDKAPTATTPTVSGKYVCGAPDQNQMVTSINFGCTGKGNPIIDLTFAIIRFLSNGVGLVVVGSIVYAGIQYTASRADPQAVAAAQERIRSSIIALVIYIFAYAILNYVIPNGFLHQ